jgi:hypothetical protein
MRRSAAKLLTRDEARIAGEKPGCGGNNRFHHFHNRFRNRNFFAFGFGGPIYDYAYGSCWAQVPTRFGWQWIYVCGDYWGY